MAQSSYAGWNTNRVVQVVMGEYTTAAALTTGTTMTDSGVTATITPRSTSSKILVMYTLSLAQSTGDSRIKLLRGASSIFEGTPAGSKSTATNHLNNLGGAEGATTMFYSYLDSPATTSATTYKIQTGTATAGDVGYINRGSTDTDADGTFRSYSNIILVEVL